MLFCLVRSFLSYDLWFLCTSCLKSIVLFTLKISKNCILQSNNTFLSIKLSKPSLTKLQPVFLVLEWHKNLQKLLRNSEDISSEREGCQRATLHQGFISWTLHYWEKKSRLCIIELRILHMDLYYAIVLLFSMSHFTGRIDRSATSDDVSHHASFHVSTLHPCVYILPSTPVNSLVFIVHVCTPRSVMNT